MTFKDEIQAKILNTSLSLAIQSDLFDLDSVVRAIDLAEALFDEIELEDPENDSAIHNVVAETLSIYVQAQLLTDDVSVPYSKQGDLVLVTNLYELLRERNAQIILNDILGG